MATENVTAPARPAEAQLVRVPDEREKAEEMESKLLQLHAMLEMTYGNAETFSGMSETLRDRFLWACADKAGECAALASEVVSYVCRAKAGEGAAHG